MKTITIISLKEAARYLAVHPHTLRLMAKQGRIPYIRFDRHYRFRESDLERWLEGQVRDAQ